MCTYMEVDIRLCVSYTTYEEVKQKKMQSLSRRRSDISICSRLCPQSWIDLTDGSPP